MPVFVSRLEKRRSHRLNDADDLIKKDAGDFAKLWRCAARADS